MLVKKKKNSKTKKKMKRVKVKMDGKKKQKVFFLTQMGEILDQRDGWLHLQQLAYYIMS